MNYQFFTNMEMIMVFLDFLKYPLNHNEVSTTIFFKFGILAYISKRGLQRENGETKK